MSEKFFAMQYLLSLPENLSNQFQQIENRPSQEWFALSDPKGVAVGSGGGSCWLLYSQWKLSGSTLSFEEWLATESRVLIHAGGESRRLPAYAPSGKTLTPIPVFRWAKGQSLRQNLLDLQLPLYSRLLESAKGGAKVLIASGDVYIHSDSSLPELPDAKRRRYERELGLPAYNAAVLTAEAETARWFEALLAESARVQEKGEEEVARAASNWVISDLFGALNRVGRHIEDSPVSPEQGAELLALIADGTISNSLGKQVFEIMLETGDSPARIVEERGLKQTSDTGAIEAVIAEIMAKNEDKVVEYRGGKDKLFGFFVGQTMKAMAGKANPQVVNELLKKALG